MHNPRMPNLASVLKSEVARLARKELRAESEALKKTVSSQRAELVAMKRRLQDLEKLVRALGRANEKRPGGKANSAALEPLADEGVRFSAKGMASNRRRLGLSAADFGLLVGATGQSVYQWEAGKSKPRAKSLSAIAGLRGIGKKEVAERLAAMKGGA